MGDDMFIIAYEQAVIMHDQRHIHVIMNIIVNPSFWQRCFYNITYSRSHEISWELNEIFLARPWEIQFEFLVLVSKHENKNM